MIADIIFDWLVERLRPMIPPFRPFFQKGAYMSPKVMKKRSSSKISSKVFSSL